MRSRFFARGRATLPDDCCVLPCLTDEACSTKLRCFVLSVSRADWLHFASAGCGAVLHCLGIATNRLAAPEPCCAGLCPNCAPLCLCRALDDQEWPCLGAVLSGRDLPVLCAYMRRSAFAEHKAEVPCLNSDLPSRPLPLPWVEQPCPCCALLRLGRAVTCGAAPCLCISSSCVGVPCPCCASRRLNLPWLRYVQPRQACASRPLAMPCLRRATQCVAVATPRTVMPCRRSALPSCAMDRRSYVLTSDAVPLPTSCRPGR